MKLKLLILLSVIIQSCGVKNEQGSENSQSMASSGDLSDDTIFVAQGESLPECNAGNYSQMYWVDADSLLKICTSAGFVDVGQEGPKGDPGDPGTKGEVGPQGEQGPAGNNANPAIWAFDANDQAVGMVFNSSGENHELLLPNGAIFALDTSDGTFSAGPVWTDGGLLLFGLYQVCYFESNDCSGTCYIRENDGTYNVKPMKGAAFYTGTNWAMANGDEVASAVDVASVWTNGQCSSFPPASQNVYPITTTFDPGFTMPITTPLHFGLKPNQ